MGRHAYLLLVHANPWQLKQLLSTLDHPDNDIYLHIDRKAPFGYDEFLSVCRHSRLYCIKDRIAIHWGGVSIINAEMALLSEAVKTSHSYYHLLSGMDLPIKSQEYIHGFFKENDGKEFLDVWKIQDHTLKRVQYYTLFPEGSHFFLTNQLNHVFKAILQVFGLKRNRDIEFKQGSQWFSITHGLACYIVSQEDWVRKVFARSCICDEIFIPTLVWRSPYRDKLFCSDQTEGHEITQSNMRLIDWSRGRSIRHPWVFTSDDYEMLKEAPHLWARKFDERVDASIIEKIVALVGTGGQIQGNPVEETIE